MRELDMSLRIQTAFVALLFASICGADLRAQQLDWSQLPSIPDVTGFAGPIAGVTRGKLLVAGGANFPEKPPWEGGSKRWHDTIFVLDEPAGRWRIAGKLPRRSAYSVCVTTPHGIAVCGGSNESGHLADCFWLRLNGGRVEIEPLPPLPLAISNACGSMLAGRLYLAGGTPRPDSVEALNVFLSLDVERPQLGWRKEPAWPGAARMLATAAAQHGAFFLVGGVSLSSGDDGRPLRTYMRDAYKFVPESGWSRIADLPRPLAAGPSPAPTWGACQFLLLGGDDGNQVASPPQEHTGFWREIMVFDVSENQWSKMGVLPTALVTTTAILWQQRIVVPGGEIRPGVRSTEVLSGSANKQ
jgi:N-acetylneuraminic acid mutarotase